MGKEKQHPKPWAEKIADLKGIDSRKATRAFEWGCEWISYWLSCWAFLEVLEYAGKLGILIAAIAYIYPGCSERKQAAEDSKKSRHYVAWQTLNSADGKPGNAGRLDALQDLNQDGVVLDGISLSGATIIGPLMLTNGTMKRASFSRGYFDNVNFLRTVFDQSQWSYSSVQSCDFGSCDISDSVFTNVFFTLCNLDSADLSGTAFMEDPVAAHNKFWNCSCVGTHFSHSSWNAVQFLECNLAYADLDGVEINTNSSFFRCNLFGAKNASPSFLAWVARSSEVAFTNITAFDSWFKFINN